MSFDNQMHLVKYIYNIRERQEKRIINPLTGHAPTKCDAKTLGRLIRLEPSPAHLMQDMDEERMFMFQCYLLEYPECAGQ